VDAYVLIYRVFAVGLVVYWAIQLADTARKPAAGFHVPRSELLPIRITRSMWLVASVLGMSAGLAVLAFSFVYFG
jgi:hypothetical protein